MKWAYYPITVIYHKEATQSMSKKSRQCIQTQVVRSTYNRHSHCNQGVSLYSNSSCIVPTLSMTAPALLILILPSHWQRRPSLYPSYPLHDRTLLILILPSQWQHPSYTYPTLSVTAPFLYSSYPPRDRTLPILILPSQWQHPSYTYPTLSVTAPFLYSSYPPRDRTLPILILSSQWQHPSYTHPTLPVTGPFLYSSYPLSDSTLPILILSSQWHDPSYTHPSLTVTPLTAPLILILYTLFVKYKILTYKLSKIARLLLSDAFISSPQMIYNKLPVNTARIKPWEYSNHRHDSHVNQPKP